MSKHNLKRILTSSWIVTVSATMIGVFVAIYANNWVESNKIQKQKSIATRNVLTEITENIKNVEIALEKHFKIYETLRFMQMYLNEDHKLIASVSMMNDFREKYPNTIEMTDSIQLNDSVFKYSGNMNLDLSLPQLAITNISWNTIKSSGLSAHYSFQCLKYLESIDKMENEVVKNNTELLQYFTGQKDAGEKNEVLLKHLEFLIEFETSLLKAYQKRDVELKECN